MVGSWGVFHVHDVFAGKYSVWSHAYLPTLGTTKETKPMYDEHERLAGVLGRGLRPLTQMVCSGMVREA